MGVKVFLGIYSWTVFFVAKLFVLIYASMNCHFWRDIGQYILFGSLKTTFYKSFIIIFKNMSCYNNFILNYPQIFKKKNLFWDLVKIYPYTKITLKSFYSFGVYKHCTDDRHIHPSKWIYSQNTLHQCFEPSKLSLHMLR